MFDDDVNERDSSFFDDLDEREILDQVHSMGQGLNMSKSSMRQDDLPPVSDTIEASFYGLENLSSIEELVRGNRGDS
jgi:hypothetical protein